MSPCPPHYRRPSAHGYLHSLSRRVCKQRVRSRLPWQRPNVSHTCTLLRCKPSQRFAVTSTADNHLPHAASLTTANARQHAGIFYTEFCFWVFGLAAAGAPSLPLPYPSLYPHRCQTSPEIHTEGHGERCRRGAGRKRGRRRI